MAVIQVRQCDRCGSKSNPLDGPDEFPEGWHVRPLPVNPGDPDEVEDQELCQDCDRKLIEFSVNRRANPKVHLCEDCPGASFSNHQSLAAHKRHAHGTNGPRPIDPAAAQAAMDRTAPLPGKTSAFNEDLARYRDKEIDPKGPVLGCGDCDFITHGAVSINTHAESAHQRRATREERVPLSGKVKEERLRAAGVEVPA